MDTKYIHIMMRDPRTGSAVLRIKNDISTGGKYKAYLSLDYDVVLVSKLYDDIQGAINDIEESAKEMIGE